MTAMMLELCIDFLLYILAVTASIWAILHFIVGPNLLKKFSKRPLTDNYLWFGNILVMKDDLIGVYQHTGDKKCLLVAKSMKATMLILSIGWVLFVVLVLTFEHID